MQTCTNPSCDKEVERLSQVKTFECYQCDNKGDDAQSFVFIGGFNEYPEYLCVTCHEKEMATMNYINQ